jgi:hypothetical protein
MKSLFEPEAFSEIKKRLANLTENSPKQWGKMTHAQMLHHCQGPLNITLEKNDYGIKPNWLARLFFKKSLYSDKPWSKGLPTAKFLRETQDRDFKTEKANLEALLDEFEANRDRTDWKPHPGFGKFTREQYGKMHYKHLDHHFRQFGV